MIVEAGIEKFPAGRTLEEAEAEAAAAYARKPLDGVFRVGRSMALDEVNSIEFAPGTTVLFERGGVWRGQLRVRSGIPGHPVRYGAFGAGPSPVIQPSRARDCVSDWREEPDGLWSAESGARGDVGNVILDGGESGCLFRRERRGDARDDRDYYFDPVAGRVYVRSASGNPAARWRSVELALKIHAIDEALAHDVEFESIAVRYSAAHGIGGGGVKRISIRDCDISWIGGGYLYIDTLGHGVRYGNGIELWGGAEDVSVEGCRVSQCWDAGLTNQTNEPGSVQRSIVWRGNAVSACEYSYEFWHQGDGGIAEGIVFADNDCRDAGAGWGHSQRWNPNAAHLMFYDTTVPTPGFTVSGNVFARSADVLARVFNDWDGAAGFSGNRWERGEGEPVCRYHGRPRGGLRYKYPDRLDQIHCDDAAEIEAHGYGARVFADRFPWESGRCGTAQPGKA